MLRHIQRPETDPYYNLAAEEYLLKAATVNTFMTWQNEPSVIIGKHQNTSREVNHAFIESLNVPVIRRITGGGTVYHDHGNINYTFIYTDRKENLVDFRYFTQPIIMFLKVLGLSANFEGKNNITIDGFKVSGNSAHIYKNKVLHHGTLLFNTDLDRLNNSVAGNDAHYKDKSVRSVRAEVTNISNLLKETISLEKFTGLFNEFIFNHFTGAFKDSFHPEEVEAIKKLAEEKYCTFKWNIGYSPEYHYFDEWKTETGSYSVSLVVKDGLIRQAEIQGPGIHSNLINQLAITLDGARHEKKSITERLKKLTFADKNEKEIINQIVNHLF